MTQQRKRPGSVKSLEDLGRVRLSENFFMRDFLYSEVANLYGLPNIPDDPAATEPYQLVNVYRTINGGTDYFLVGQAPAGGYEGEGFIILRHRETAVVEQALQTIVDLIRVELG